MNKLVQFDVVKKLITVTEQMRINDVYSIMQDTFDEPGFMQHSVPMSAQTPTQYTLINGWNFADEASKNNLTDGAWEVIEGSWPDVKIKETWVHIVTIGSLEPSDLRLQYRIDDGEWQDFKRPGMINEVIYKPEGSKTIEVRAPFKDKGSLYKADLYSGSIHIPIWFSGGIFNQDVAARLEEAGPEEIELLLSQI